MAFWAWSKTAASNATADSTINWSEGQSPSSVNDSARAQMARTAEWRDDISGTITTAGTSTAYTIASNQIFDTLAHMNGAMIAFVPHTTCGATVTVNVDGLGAKPLRSAPSVELSSGVLIAGTPYICTYNNSDGVFYLQNFYSLPFAIPVGGMMPYIGSTAPNSNFVIPIGQAISRTTYATLFALTSTTYGIGDGTTTFNVPDLRGRTTFQIDSGGSGKITVAGGNSDGTVLGGTGGAQNHTMTTAEMPAHSHTFTGSALAPHSHTTGATNSSVSYSGSGGNNSPTFGTTATSSDSAGTPAGTNSSTGGGTAHTIMPPYILLPYILRVL